MYSDFLSYFFGDLALPDYVIAFGGVLVLCATLRVLISLADLLTGRR